MIPVHLYGHAVPFTELAAMSCFSFYPAKNLGALGDGGMVVNDDGAVVEEIRRIRDHGRTSKYVHDTVGWCSRLDGLQAAFLDVKLRHLPDWTTARRALAARDRSRLTDDTVRLVPWNPGAVHHQLVVRVAAARRAEIQQCLERQGIGTGIHYPVPLSRQPAFLPWSTPTPAADLAADEVLSLPMDPLMTLAEVDAVCDALEAVTRETGAPE